MTTVQPAVRRAGGRLRDRLVDPVWWVDVVHLLKTALAAVLAWVAAHHVLGLDQSFLAPWSAILVVHATVFRTAWRAVQQVAMTVVGVLLAFLAAAALGVGTTSLAVVTVAALALGVPRLFRAVSTTAAATAVVVLLTGAADDQAALVERLVDTALGIGFGFAVTLLVWPPLRDRAMVCRVAGLRSALGELMVDMARGITDGAGDEQTEDWVERTRLLDDDVEVAEAMARQASESGRMNPRSLRARRRVAGLASWSAVVDRVEQAVADCRSMARTVQRDLSTPSQWDTTFTRQWTTLLSSAGAAVVDDDAGRLGDVRARLDELVRELYEQSDSTPPQPLYGALILNLRNIAGSMEDVALARFDT